MKMVLIYMRMFISLYYAKRNKPDLSRSHLNSIIGALKDKIDFLTAYNARILMMEGRHQEARECLKSIVQKFSDTSDIDKLYILKYSQFHLALYEKDKVARELKSEAIKLNPRGSVRNFLPFFSDAAISRILN